MDIKFEFCKDYKLLEPVYKEHVKYLNDNNYLIAPPTKIEELARSHALISFKSCGEIIGFSSIFNYGDHCLHISYTHVVEPFRQKGIYNKYLGWLMNYCKENKYNTIISCVHNDNKAMLAVKKSLGHEPMATYFKINV
ncbi:MAG: GNAT family N-acetyltransferase [Candidatus Anammoxibacter sp.]